MKKYPTKRVRTTQIGFEGFSDGRTEYIADMRYASTANNFAFENKGLFGTIGVAAAKNFAPTATELPAAPSAIKNVFFYKHSQKNVADDRLVIQLTNGSFHYTYLSKADTWHAIEGLKIKDDVMAVNYNYLDTDRLLLCSPNDYLYVVEGESALYVKDAPRFSCFAIHNERLFGGVNGARPKLWFSDDFDPFNWKVSADEAGYIVFDDDYGDIVQLLSFNGHLYIFRQYAIFRLTAYAKQSEFVLKTVCTGMGQIGKNSVALCGGVAIFAAGDTLYVFDGYEARKLTDNMPKLKKVDGMSAAFLDGMYYLACRITNRLSSMVNDVILRYSFKDKTVSVFNAANPLALFSVKSAGKACVFVVLQDAANATKLGQMSADGKYMGTATQKTYMSTMTLLGTHKPKTVRKITLITNAAAKVTVFVDDYDIGFDAVASYMPQTFVVEKTGSLVGVSIQTSAALPQIPPMTLEYDL